MNPHSLANICKYTINKISFNTHLILPLVDWYNQYKKDLRKLSLVKKYIKSFKLNVMFLPKQQNAILKMEVIYG